MTALLSALTWTSFIIALIVLAVLWVEHPEKFAGLKAKFVAWCRRFSKQHPADSE